MNASFEEKSVWIQLIGMVGVLGTYFVLAAQMYAAGVFDLRAYAALFIVAVVVMVVVLVVGHIVAAITRRADPSDERDRLIGWRAEANASWIVGVGVLTGITGMVLAYENVLVAHVLLLSMFLSEVVKYALQLVYYRRGV